MKDKIKKLTEELLSEVEISNKWQHDFLVHLFDLLVSLRGRYNFLNLARYGDYSERTYRNWFERDFDFLSFNKKLALDYLDEELICGFDPTFITKSGKHTPGYGYFWSGKDGRAKKGLELGGFGVIDIKANTATHLLGVQTLDVCKFDSFLAYYAHLIRTYGSDLKEISAYLAVDAFFSKQLFVDTVVDEGLHIVSRLRKDAYLRYRYVGPHPKRRGRKTVYAGKVDALAPDESFFRICIEDREQGIRVYEGEAHVRSLKRWCRIAIVHYLDDAGEVTGYAIYFSDDLQMDGTQLYTYYKSRFQVEFLYRDAKQYTGLEHHQSRSEQKLDFHFNASLTAVSLAKVAHYLSQPIKERGSFSMADIKTEHFNRLMLDSFICIFGIDPNEAKKHPGYQKLVTLGKIAA